jgi:hypothetical protein
MVGKAMNRAMFSDSFGSRATAGSQQKDMAAMTDIESRKMSIERDAKRRKLMWEEALNLARSGKFTDALAVESELTSMGYNEAKHAFSEQDLRQIQAACDQANARAKANGTPANAAAAHSNVAVHPAAAQHKPQPREQVVKLETPMAANGQGTVRMESARPSGIGRLARVPAAEVWQEDFDMAAWMVDNQDVASEILGFPLARSERSRTPEGIEFSVAEDASGHRILIEGRLNRSAGDQLGTLMSNLTVCDPHVVVWLVADALPEFVRVVDWLNQGGHCSFFLVKVEAVRIGNSDPAPMLSLISGPTPTIAN